MNKIVLQAMYGIFSHSAGRELKKYYPGEMVKKIINATKMECKDIIPRLPDIGGMKNAYAVIPDINGWIISLYRAVKKQNIETVVAVFVSRQVLKKMMERIPHWLGRRLKKLAFSERGLAYFSRQAQRSQKKEYPMDFVYTFIYEKDEGGHMTGSFEFTECAVHKLYEAEGVEELKSFCNFADPLIGARFGMGVNADHTFAQGCKTCTLSLDSTTPTHTPENIQKMMNQASMLLARSKNLV